MTIYQGVDLILTFRAQSPTIVLFSHSVKQSPRLEKKVHFITFLFFFEPGLNVLRKTNSVPEITPVLLQALWGCGGGQVLL